MDVIEVQDTEREDCGHAIGVCKKKMRGSPIRGRLRSREGRGPKKDLGSGGLGRGECSAEKKEEGRRVLQASAFGREGKNKGRGKKNGGGGGHEIEKKREEAEDGRGGVTCQKRRDKRSATKKKT